MPIDRTLNHNQALMAYVIPCTRAVLRDGAALLGGGWPPLNCRLKLGTANTGNVRFRSVVCIVLSNGTDVEGVHTVPDAGCETCRYTLKGLPSILKFLARTKPDAKLYGTDAVSACKVRPASTPVAT